MLNLALEFQQIPRVLGIVLGPEDLRSGEGADRLLRDPAGDGEEMSHFLLLAAQDGHLEVAGGAPVVRDRAPLQERRVFIGTIARRPAVPDANDHVISRDAGAAASRRALS